MSSWDAALPGDYLGSGLECKALYAFHKVLVSLQDGIKMIYKNIYKINLLNDLFYTNESSENPQT